MNDLYVLNGCVFKQITKNTRIFKSNGVTPNRALILDEEELQALGATLLSSELREKQSTGEMYKCPSYYDNNNQLQNCTCGKCHNHQSVKERCTNCKRYLSECDCLKNVSPQPVKKIELPTELGTFTDFSQSYGTCTGTLKFVGPTTQMKKWMESVTNWINSQEEK